MKVPYLLKNRGNELRHPTKKIKALKAASMVWVTERGCRHRAYIKAIAFSMIFIAIEITYTWAYNFNKFTAHLKPLDIVSLISLKKLPSNIFDTGFTSITYIINKHIHAGICRPKFFFKFA